jgi:hypothetical protein
MTPLDEIDRWVRSANGDESRRIAISFDREYGWLADAQMQFANEWGSGGGSVAEATGRSLSEALGLLNAMLEGKA